MFKTHESVAFGSLGQFGDGYRHWRLIERDLNNPWFHLTVRFEDRGENRVKSVFPNDVNILAHLVSEAGNGIEVVAVQAVLPIHITGKSCWIMSPVEKLEGALQESGEPVTIFHLEGGEIFTDPPLADDAIAALAEKTTLYLKHPLLQS